MSNLQKALGLTAVKGDFVVYSVAKPNAGPGEVVVRIEATALNPVDWMIQEYGFFVREFPAILGCDAAGVIEATGEGVTQFAAGDRVLFEGHFVNALGTFQQYVAVSAALVAKIPTNITFDQAATVPLGLATAAIGLYDKKTEGGGADLAPVWEAGGRGKHAGKPFLLFGGATSVGQYVIQLAKLSGFSPIIATASLHNTELLKSLGATHIIDRHNLSTLAESVKAITTTPLGLVYGIFGDAQVQTAAYELLAPGATFVYATPKFLVEEGKRTPDKVAVHVFGSLHATNNRSLAESLCRNLTELLQTGDLKPNQLEVIPGGLAGVASGLERLRQNKVSGLKLVVHPMKTA